MAAALKQAEDAKLTDIFRTILDAPGLVLKDDLTASEVPGWDSFNHINLVMQVEEDFGVRFSTEEISSLKNVGEFKALLARKLA
jgi:acyl carrier protein